VTQYLIDLTNQSSGLVGPFVSEELANRYADSTFGEVGWEVRELFEPDDAYCCPGCGTIDPFAHSGARPLTRRWQPNVSR
jgi:hypothetical protein